MTSSSRVLSLALALILGGGAAMPVLARDEAPTSALDATASSVEARGPSLPDDLPQRRTMAVPRFVGPARLKLKGGPGRYTWHRLLFGAEEVEARVRLRPDVESCLLRLRVIEDGEPLVREWFGTGAGANGGVDAGSAQTHESVLRVDYSAGSVKVDSDCASWSVRLSPLDDPDLDVVIRESHYTVRGHSLDDLAQQTRHVRDRWAAFTEWYTTWSHSTGISGVPGATGSRCLVNDGRTRVEVSVVLPRWDPPAGTDPAVIAEWRRFLRHLRIHEGGHVTIALQGADAIDDRLDRGFTAPTCKQAGAMADERAMAIFERYSRVSRRYDRETDHGLAQGTGLG